MTNAEIRQGTNTKDIVVAAQRLKWQWGGHVARMVPAKMGKCCINVGRKCRQKENWGNRRPPWQTRSS